MSELLYYHARGTPLEEGKALQCPWRRMMKSDPEPFIDDLFERLRQGRGVQRNIAVFMIALPSDMLVTAAHFGNIGVQSAEYVYRLSPTTAVSEHDWYWARELHARHPPLIGGKKRHLSSFQPDADYKNVTDEEIVERYWQGIASTTPRLEYLTESATVIERSL